MQLLEVQHQRQEAGELLLQEALQLLLEEEEDQEHLNLEQELDQLDLWLHLNNKLKSLNLFL